MLDDCSINLELLSDNLIASRKPPGWVKRISGKIGRRDEREDWKYCNQVGVPWEENSGKAATNYQQMVQKCSKSGPKVIQKWAQRPIDQFPQPGSKENTIGPMMVTPQRTFLDGF